MGGTLKNIRQTFSIGRGSRERFVPMRASLAAPLGDIGVEMAGLSDLGAGYRVGRPDASFHVIIYTLAGRGRLVTEGGERALGKGDMTVLPAHAAHAYRSVGNRWRIAWFHLGETEAWRGLRAAGPTVRTSDFVKRLEACIEGLLAESLRPDAAAKRAARLHAELVATYLQRELEPADPPAARARRRELWDLWDRVNADLARPWTVADLARELHVSPVQCHRLCERYARTKPMKMVTRLRMLRAEELLRSADIPIKQIAPLVGYGNTFAFSVAFKRHAGKSPRRFRERADG
jgi:AraC-like DNA-binding protein